MFRFKTQGHEWTQASSLHDGESFFVKLWIDADACPTLIKDVLFRTANRLELETCLVANQSIRIPDSKYITSITVRDGADVADGKIVELLQAKDIVITADIPLAARVVEKDAIAISPRGERFDAATIQSRLASRNLMEHLRSAGMETKGPKPFSQKDVQNFCNVLDRTITQLLKAERNGAE